MPLIQWEQMVTKSCWQQVHIIKVKTKENERFRKKKARWNAKTLSEWEEGSPCFTTKPTNPRHFIVFFIGFLGSIVLRQNQSSALWATQWNVLLCSLVPQRSWCWRRTKQFYFESNSSCLFACFLISTYFLKLNWVLYHYAIEYVARSSSVKAPSLRYTKCGAKHEAIEVSLLQCPTKWWWW